MIGLAPHPPDIHRLRATLLRPLDKICPYTSLGTSSGFGMHPTQSNRAVSSQRGAKENISVNPNPVSKQLTSGLWFFPVPSANRVAVLLGILTVHWDPPSTTLVLSWLATG